MTRSTLFSQTVRDLARSIPPGHVTTYGILARAAGGGGQAARSITSILARDPDPKTIPFHRIVYSSGKVWTSEACSDERMEQYKKEGIAITENGTIENFRDHLYTFGMRL